MSSQLQDEMIKILIAWHIPKHKALLLSGELLGAVELETRAAVAAERERCIHAVEECRVIGNAPTWEVKRAIINALCDLD